MYYIKSFFIGLSVTIVTLGLVFLSFWIVLVTKGYILLTILVVFVLQYIGSVIYDEYLKLQEEKKEN